VTGSVSCRASIAEPNGNGPRARKSNRQQGETPAKILSLPTRPSRKRCAPATGYGEQLRDDSSAKRPRCFCRASVKPMTAAVVKSSSCLLGACSGKMNLEIVRAGG
jgi:hypothetical protein